MIMEHLCNDTDKGEKKVLRKQPLPMSLLHPIWTDLGSNPDLRYESPAIERLSHFTVFIHVGNTSRMYSCSSHCAADTLSFHYSGQAMEADYGNCRYWLLESYRTHTRCVVVWGKCRVLMLRLELYIVASEH